MRIKITENRDFFDRCLTAYQEAARQFMVPSDAKSEAENKESKTVASIASIDKDLLIFKKFLNSLSAGKLTVFTRRTLLNELNEQDKKVCKELLNSNGPQNFCTILTKINKEQVSASFRTLLSVFFSMTPHWRKYLGKEIIDFFSSLHHFLPTKDCAKIGKYIWFTKYIDKLFNLPDPDDESFDIQFNSILENCVIYDYGNLHLPKFLTWLSKIPKEYAKKFANRMAQQYTKTPSSGDLNDDYYEICAILAFTIAMLPWMDVKHREIVYKIILIFPNYSSDTDENEHFKVFAEAIIKVPNFQTIIPQNILLYLITGLNKELDAICTNLHLHSGSDHSKVANSYQQLIVIDRILSKLKSENTTLEKIPSGLNQSFLEGLINLLENRHYPHKNLIFKTLCQLSVDHPTIMEHCHAIFIQLLECDLKNGSKKTIGLQLIDNTKTPEHAWQIIESTFVLEDIDTDSLELMILLFKKFPKLLSPFFKSIDWKSKKIFNHQIYLVALLIFEFDDIGFDRNIIVEHLSEAPKNRNFDIHPRICVEFLLVQIRISQHPDNQHLSIIDILDKKRLLLRHFDKDSIPKVISQWFDEKLGLVFKCFISKISKPARIALIDHLFTPQSLVSISSLWELMLPQSSIQFNHDFVSSYLNYIESKIPARRGFKDYNNNVSNLLRILPFEVRDEFMHGLLKLSKPYDVVSNFLEADRRLGLIVPLFHPDIHIPHDLIFHLYQNLNIILKNVGQFGGNEFFTNIAQAMAKLSRSDIDADERIGMVFQEIFKELLYNFDHPRSAHPSWAKMIIGCMELQLRQEMSSIMKELIRILSEIINSEYLPDSYIFVTIIRLLEIGITRISPHEARDILLDLHQIKCNISWGSNVENLFICAAIDRVYSKMRASFETESLVTTNANLPIPIYNIISEYLGSNSDLPELISDPLLKP